MKNQYFAQLAGYDIRPRAGGPEGEDDSIEGHLGGNKFSVGTSPGEP